MTEQTRRTNRLLVAVAAILAGLICCAALTRDAMAQRPSRPGRPHRSDVERLIESLKSSSPTIQRTAAAGLGEIGDRRAVRPLIKLLPDSKVNQTVIHSLGMLRDRRATAPLVQILKDKESPRRQDVAEALFELRDPAAAAALKDVLTESTEMDPLRLAAARALAAVGDEDGIKLLLIATQGENVRLKCQAIEALAASGKKDGVEAALSALKDSDSTVRCCAVTSLGKTGSLEFVEPLGKMLADSDAATRSAAKLALANTPSPKSMELLLDAYQREKESNQRILCTLAMAQLHENLLAQSQQDALEARVVQAVKTIFGGKDESLLTNLAGSYVKEDRIGAASAMGMLADPRTIRSLDRIYDDGLVRCRLAAVRALGQISNSFATQTLQKASKDDDQAVAKLAAQMLSKPTSQPTSQPK